MKIFLLSFFALTVGGCGRPESPPSSAVRVPDTSTLHLSEDLHTQVLTVDGVDAKKSKLDDQVGGGKSMVEAEAAAEEMHRVSGVSDVPPEVLILDPVSIALNKAHLRPHEVSNGPWGECNLIINVLAMVSMERDRGFPSSVSERNVKKILVEAEASDADVVDWVSAARAVHTSSVASVYIVDVLGEQCSKLVKEGSAR